MKKRNLLCISAVCSTFIFIFSCSKENIDSPDDPIAKFTIVQSASSCNDIVTNDLFFVGEAISGADSIRIQVDVSTAGSWNYHSDTINGVSFSGSGILANTGLQYISFAPAGTPVLPGNFVHSFIIDTSEVNVTASVIEKTFTPEAVPADEIPYFKLTLDNTDYHVVFRNNDPSDQVGGWGPSLDSGSLMSGIGPDIYPNPPGTGSISIQKNYFGTINPANTDNDFKSFFQPGAYRFALRQCDRLTDGLFIGWSDSDDNIWTTIHGKGQEGSYFKIVGIINGYNSKGEYYVKIKMRFGCKLYSYPAGQMKVLTNGETLAYYVWHK